MRSVSRRISCTFLSLKHSNSSNLHLLRHFYPASQYDVDVHPYKGKVMEMLAEISGGDHFYQTIKGNDPVIFTR
jgi:hypothetical protein